MPELQRLNSSDTGLCEYGNFLPCNICDEARNKIGNEVEGDNEDIKGVKKELLELGIEAAKEKQPE